MTVKELIMHLKSIPKDAVVVVFDHFGRPIEYEKYDFSHYKSSKGCNPQGATGDFLVISQKDIGPEPD